MENKELKYFFDENYDDPEEEQDKDGKEKREKEEDDSDGELGTEKEVDDGSDHDKKEDGVDDDQKTKEELTL